MAMVSLVWSAAGLGMCQLVPRGIRDLVFRVAFPWVLRSSDQPLTRAGCSGVGGVGRVLFLPVDGGLCAVSIEAST